MAQTEKDEVVTTEDKKDGKKKVSEYLQAPRKKRKRYVIMALSGKMQAEVAGGLESFVRSGFKTLAVASPKSPEELQKTFSRQIVLLIYDDEFSPLDQGLTMLAELKRRKVQTTVPLLFMTRDPEGLVEGYHKFLAPFHETDDYINYPKVEPGEIYSRVRHALTFNNRRRSRRYKIDLPLDYYLLTDDKIHKGRLLDLSVHGAMLRDESGRIFEPGDQLKIHIPIAAYINPKAGDYLKLSARVRRIFIIGSEVGISFEYLTEEKLLILTRFLTKLVTEQYVRKSIAMRIKAGR